ncbi:MAG: shikimate kinase, partial [Epsilonproteobacteria bacterium]|nr:shikimate kinase [Campylobacterota bacterium]
VLLDSPFEEILKRIQDHPNAENKLKKRPLLSDLEKAKALYEMRRPEYLKVADIVVEVTNKSAKDSAKEILKKVKNG